MFPLAVLLPAMLLALFPIPSGAQAAAAAPNRGPIPTYNAAHETTINGTVQQVVTKRTIGSPAGMHLIVTGATGTVDVHVGPFLSKEVREALHTGLPIQIVGATETLNGKQYLLARQLMYGGITVPVRSANGVVLRGALPSNVVSPKAQKAAQLAANGGAR
ncbi:MAG: hypothetical protein ACRD3B_08900 [Candidatus Sulfotelmatobacter sp.]